MSLVHTHQAVVNCRVLTTPMEGTMCGMSSEAGVGAELSE